ncbi:MAG: alpha/beta hydrolase [Flavobacteriales bacterium]|nr:alpha/beta hydrolase [Flavobacteriales bacterium]
MRYIGFLIIVFGLTACIKLNDIAFYNEPITDYLLDDYNIDLDFKLDSTYNVKDIHEFSVNSNGFDIAAIYIGDLSDIDTDTIILYCHGQTRHMDHYWQRAKLLANCGGKERYGVLMFDYRGYGKSEGTPTEQGMYEDVRATYQWLLHEGAPSQRIIIYGFSLGSAPATDLVAYGMGNEFPLKLILESPFASTDFIAQESTLIEVSASYITELEFDNAEKIKLVDQPLMWMHGIEDDYVAITNGEAIISNYSGSDSTYIRVEGANHGQDGVPQTMGYQNYLNAVQEFIEFNQ